MNVAEIRNLSKRYPAFSLKDISFNLEKGRIAGFIGRNGAGKTTTIKCMMNLVHPDSGEISYFGQTLQGHESEIKQRIGYSSGAVNYYPRKKLKDIIKVTNAFYSNWDDATCHEYLKLFNLDVNKTPSELSDGMKVKVNLLLALSHRAEILILDEPTSGLDPFSRDELLEIFLMLKERGTAILFSTHITSDLEKCADDIMYIHDGKLIAALPREEFRQRFSQPGETLEETMLRLERNSRE